MNPQCAFAHWRDLRLIFLLLCNASDTLRPFMCLKVSPVPFSLNEHHGNFAVRSGNRTLSVHESNLHCIHRNAPSYERYRCNVNHLGSIEGLGYHSALVCTHRFVSCGLPPAAFKPCMKEGEMRTQVQHVCVEAAFINTIARRMPACMPPNNLAALGPRGEQTPSQDTVISS